jgi:hypothetical protein
VLCCDLLCEASDRARLEERMDGRAVEADGLMDLWVDSGDGGFAMVVDRTDLFVDPGDG